MAGTCVVRTLRESDIPAAMQLKNAAGWNQTEQDWRNLLRLAPDGCFGVECDGRLVSTTTAVCYGSELAWIGMVLTDPAYRSRGFARQLMEHALEFLERRQVQWIKLDATDLGRPLYGKLGFREEQPIERWVRKAGPIAQGNAVRLAVPHEWRSFDREAFGADRWELLGLLAAIESAALPGAGYAMGRSGCKAAYFGPCVSRSFVAARCLLGWFLSTHSGENTYCDLLPSNEDAVQLAREVGFQRDRELVRMARCGMAGAAPLVCHENYIFAIAGFEFG